jgi:YggT family protein
MIKQLLVLILNLYSFLLIAHAAMTWFKIDDNHPTKLFIGKAVKPVLEPVKKVIPPFNGIDLSVLVVLFGIYLIRPYLS